MYFYDDDGRRYEMDDEIDFDDNLVETEEFLEYARDFDYDKYGNL